MNALEQAVVNALNSEGESKLANKAYLEFIKANFFIPVKKPLISNQEITNNEPEVLFYQENQTIFLPVFSSMKIFDCWAEPIKKSIQVLTLTGVNLLTGIGDNVTISLNLSGTPYKEFNPAELARMRSMVIKLFKT